MSSSPVPDSELGIRHTQLKMEWFPGAHSLEIYIHLKMFKFVMAKHNDNDLHWVLGRHI